MSEIAPDGPDSTTGRAVSQGSLNETSDETVGIVGSAGDSLAKLGDVTVSAVKMPPDGLLQYAERYNHR